MKMATEKPMSQIRSESHTRRSAARGASPNLTQQTQHAQPLTAGMSEMNDPARRRPTVPYVAGISQSPRKAASSAWMMNW